jgi:hypothetical protein
MGLQPVDATLLKEFNFRWLPTVWADVERVRIIPSLFDHVPRYTGPALASEGSFSFLNRAASGIWQRTRDLVEEWYTHYPDNNGDLRARFRQDAMGQHLAAWWELYTFSLFRHLGYEIDVHPIVNGTTKRPDFRIHRDSFAAYVECTTMVEEGEWANSDSGAWLLDCINRAQNPDFMVDLTMERIGTERPRARAIIEPVEQWLASLDWDMVSRDVVYGRALPTREFTFRDWQLSLQAWPVRAERRGEPGRLVGSYLIGDGEPRQDEEDLRRILGKKGAYYGQKTQPLVLAILSSSSFVDERDLTNALFGSIAVRYYQGGIGMPPPKQIRLQNGYWRPYGQERGTRVAGVLFGDHLLKPWNPASALPLLWLNPWTPDPLPRMPPFGTRTADDNGREIASSPTQSAADLFGIQWNY